MSQQPFDAPEQGAGGEALGAEPKPSLLRAIKSWLFEVGETVLPAIVIAVLINLFLAQATRVYGSSMEPNLHTDQRLVVEKLSYRLHEPRRGDVVVLRMPERGPELLIKRVIALPGETIEVRDGAVLVNGVRLEEPYLGRPTSGTFGPTLVPEGQLFVMGDNRGASNDSRVFGPVDRTRIIGRAWISYWPLETIGLIR
ncbi:MAG: signal peptidase I [Anaerolineae bacterium]|nr:signal peptidase I [Anaerolineae bacterium]